MKPILNKCIICGSKQIRPYIKGSDLLMSKSGEFFLFKCNDCGLIFQQNPPENILDYYGCEYGCYKDKPKYVLLKAKIVKKYCNKSKILDIGCGCADFLEYLAKHGWQSFGVEPSLGAVPIDRKKIVNIFEKPFEDIDWQNQKFDVITMWDVLEHLFNPKKELTMINKLLNKDGILILNVPNSQSSSAMIFKKYWSGLDLPRHTFVYSYDNLNQLLSDSGFYVVSVINNGEIMHIWLSMTFILNSFVKNRALNRIIRKLFFPLKLFGGLLDKIFSLNKRRAASLIFICKKT